MVYFFGMTEKATLSKAERTRRFIGNFENKDEIALAVYDHNLNMVGNAIRLRLGTGDTAAET